jgi:hypothetical protein
MAAFRKACGKSFELGRCGSNSNPYVTHTSTVFIDAPILLTPPDLAWQSAPGANQSEASNLQALGAAEAQNIDSDPALAPRGWWRHNAEKTRAIGLEESLLVVRDALTKDKYEVCVLRRYFIMV